MKHNPPPPGYRFGRLVVRSVARDASSGLFFANCVCDCGKTPRVRLTHLRAGASKSCGCLGREHRIASATRHGHTRRGSARSAEYVTWCNIIDRCTRENYEFYADYGGRGITVCPTWRRSFVAFLSDMGQRPSAAHSIDRFPDNDGNYEPGNCRWATREEQARNTRAIPRYDIRGERLSVVEIQERYGIRKGTVWSRIDRGWRPTDAATLPIGSRRP